MESSSRLTGDLSSAWFYVAAASTTFCLLVALWVIRSSAMTVFRKRGSKRLGVSGSSLKSKSCGCLCSCSGSGGGSSSLTTAPYVNGTVGEMHERAPVVAEHQTGASMMEQLVPEITTHALSYLDYPSLCRLSMTNSSMRKAANDDNAWKALYHKDFTVEQDTVTPINGWKAYYAATRAIVNINAEFYNIIRERSLQAMGHHWLNADYVRCILGSGELFTGYNAVMESWQFAFNWGEEVALQVRDVRVRVLTDMAWVTTHIDDMNAVPLHETNVYEFHNGRWYMVHHHSSVRLIVGGLEQQNAHG